ncbi:UDP-N-acetylmuramoylalanyl-D-glutamyl-2,6-diaminopimelate--D-alanyl-D-alanine ligase [Bauldia sp.]|uniref:UDP-N-acetylmuramoylalanyl-D-glutamyl-2, 6-diaminopimelate--D-alanyl-D-alanine ligase n=1 Tax=Bauldia sp. TaxID=2575872 RepID=UPI003BAA8F6F
MTAEETLWTFEELVKAIDGRPVGPAPEVVTGISIDSRTISRGDVFFAIRGDTFDGHAFVSMALGAGAATAVVSESKLASLGHVSRSLVVVDDVLVAMVALAQAARARSQARIAAVTGSVGKTGTKAMLAAALEPSGLVHASPASFNNHWGVPLSLARMRPSERFGVFEIGMNHAGEIAALVPLVKPQVAIITTIEPVHLEYFDSVEGIARAKAEIFLGVTPGGAAVLNRDNVYFDLLVSLAQAAGVERVVSFGEHPEADARLEDVDLGADRSSALATILGQEIAYELGAPGRHMVHNSLAVLATTSLLGADLEGGAAALGQIGAEPGRGARHRLEVPNGIATLIDESYNANPASMRAAIALLGQATPGPNGRRFAVLGEMRELGDEAAAMHAGLATPLVEAAVDAVFVAGPMMAALWDALPESQRGGYAETAAELEPVIADILGAGDVVMIKGSNASRMGPLAAVLKERFGAPPADAGGGQGREIA